MKALPPNRKTTENSLQAFGEYVRDFTRFSEGNCENQQFISFEAALLAYLRIMTELFLSAKTIDIKGEDPVALIIAGPICRWT